MYENALCPSCNEEIPALTISCNSCGQRLRLLKISRAIPKSDSYEIVPEGQQFAISFRGDIQVHGLSQDELPRAEEIIAVLNSFIEEMDNTPALSC